MSSRILGIFQATRRPRSRLAGEARRLGRDKKGVTIVEFAIVIFPFLALLFAIVEIALVFFAGQVLETATADAARRIMTGEVQNTKMSQADFKIDLCSRLHAMFNCPTGVKIDVKKAASFAAADLTAPLDGDGNLDTSGFGWQPGTQGEIVVVRVTYEWPIFVRDFGFNLATLPSGKRLLMATAAFRNEPYKSAN